MSIQYDLQWFRDRGGIFLRTDRGPEPALAHGLRMVRASSWVPFVSKGRKRWFEAPPGHPHIPVIPPTLGRLAGRLVCQRWCRRSPGHSHGLGHGRSHGWPSYWTMASAVVLAMAVASRRQDSLWNQSSALYKNSGRRGSISRLAPLPPTPLTWRSGGLRGWRRYNWGP